MRRRRRRRVLVQRITMLTAFLVLLGLGAGIVGRRLLVPSEKYHSALEGAGQPGGGENLSGLGEGDVSGSGGTGIAPGTSLNASGQSGSDIGADGQAGADGVASGQSGSDTGADGVASGQSGSDTRADGAASGQSGSDTGVGGQAGADGAASGQSGSDMGSGGQAGENTAGQSDMAPGASAVSVDLSGIYSTYALLTDRDTGAVIGERNSKDRIYPASMTKIMTAILAIEETADLSASVTLPYEIYDSLYAEGASMAGFEPGETAALEDLVYGILLPSGAECCLTFANRIAGSEAAFAELMNQKAAELGMADTHFCNSTGLHDPNHYTTVADIAVLLRYALDNPTFREIFTSSRHSVSPTAQHPEGFTFFSTMFQYMSTAEVTGGEILGGKTGYTEEAGLCLASLASVNGKEYILVTAKADGSHETEQFHILDAQNVYNQLGAL